jgi:hypothetical protein
MIILKAIKYVAFFWFVTPIATIVMLIIFRFVRRAAPGVPVPEVALPSGNVALRHGFPVVCAATCHSMSWPLYLEYKSLFILLGGGFAVLIIATVLEILWEATAPPGASPWWRAIARGAGALSGLALTGTIIMDILMGAGPPEQQGGGWVVSNHGTINTLTSWQVATLAGLLVGACLFFFIAAGSYQIFARTKPRGQP